MSAVCIRSNQIVIWFTALSIEDLPQRKPSPFLKLELESKYRPIYLGLVTFKT